MEYKLKIQDDVLPIEVTSSDENSATAKIQDRQYDLKYAVISENELHLMVNGKSLNVYVSKNSSGKTIMLNGRIYLVQDEDNISSGPKKRRGMEGPRTITSQMPAVVICVNVKQGDRVEKGQGLVVVSAMKMETTLSAPYRGIVTQVNVTERDKVMPGQILVDIDEIREED